MPPSPPSPPSSHSSPALRSRRALALPCAAVAVGGVLAVAVAPSASAAPPAPSGKQPTAVGTGGAVTSVDEDATRIGLSVLQAGGNAVDAAVATAAALGVTEPFSAGIGGGGYFVYYDAKSGRVRTIDGRETGPASLRPDSFTSGGKALDFQEARVSGLSVGVPGTLKTWSSALSKWGTRSLDQVLAPAEQLARDGFVVDQTFHDQVATPPNPQAFATFSSTAQLFLPGGQAPAVGSVFRNPDLADTYAQIRREGQHALYGGSLGADVARTVQAPPLSATPSGWPYTVRPGGMTLDDLRRYQVVARQPTHARFRGLDVYGMPPSSSGGTTVGEALQIVQAATPPGAGRVAELHDDLEASALAFADRNAYVGDPKFVKVPVNRLLDPRFAAERACAISPTSTLERPVAPGTPDGSHGCPAAATSARGEQHEGLSTTNLTVADRWGNVVEYTLTIEQTGGSGIVVPHRGFLLNNELTDFTFTPTQGAAPDPNLPAAGKRPRSSISPTIVLSGGRPFLAVGSPGGATIITTVLQVLLDRIDLGLTLPQAIADARVSDRNGASTQAEPAFLGTPEEKALTALGHHFTVGSPSEIGAATGIEFLPGGRLLAAAEPVRRGGGSAKVVTPTP